MCHENMSVSNAAEDADEEMDSVASYILAWGPFLMGTGFSLFLATVDICSYYISTPCFRGVFSQAKSKQKPYNPVHFSYCWSLCACLLWVDSLILRRMCD